MTSAEPPVAGTINNRLGPIMTSRQWHQGASCTLLIALGSHASATSAKVLAHCGGSFGKALWPNDAQAKWSDDKITTGTFSFNVDGKGNPNILFRLRTHSQNRTVVARATADRKTVGHLS